MKKNYVHPELTASIFNVTDIITSSSALNSLDAIIEGDSGSDPAMLDGIE